jgi:hypothetical protein
MKPFPSHHKLSSPKKLSSKLPQLWVPYQPWHSRFHWWVPFSYKIIRETHSGLNYTFHNKLSSLEEIKLQITWVMSNAIHLEIATLNEFPENMNHHVGDSTGRSHSHMKLLEKSIQDWIIHFTTNYHLSKKLNSKLLSSYK